MSILLQKTKLFVPPARPRQVARPRLLAALDELRTGGGRAALVSAPAGSGKTTLVTQWLERLGWPAGWLSLDERDNLPPRFFAHLIAALQSALPGAGQSAAAMLDLPGVKVEELVTLLVNDLVDATVPVVLILDDLHVLHNPDLHHALDLLLDAQPPQLRLVLLSRADPLIALARRRARGQLVELRQADLRFTPEEAAAFIRQSMELDLTSAQMQVLEARTEGWIAGLQLAALSLQRVNDVEGFLRDFSGSHRYILDYLMEEVLARQPAELHDFLLATSVLERLSPELCAAVSGKTSAEARDLLETLSKANLFLIALDDNRRWWRYHHLFRDLLGARLQMEDAARAAELRLRASAWCVENQDARAAVEYALAAGDFQRAADLIERFIVSRWQTVDMEFHMLIGRIPPDLVRERPGLCLQNAWLCVLTGSIAAIPPLLEAAEGGLARAVTPEAAVYRAFASVLRAYLRDLDNQPVTLDPALEQAYAAIPESNPGMRNSVGMILGMICFMEGDFAAARRYYDAALELDKSIGGTNAVPIAGMRIALLLRARGELRETEHLLRDAIEYTRQRGSRRFYICGVLNLMLAEVLLEWDRLEEAETEIQAGLRLLEDWPSASMHGLGLALLARLRLARGESGPARAALEQIAEYARRTHFHPYFSDRVEHARIALLIASKDRAALEEWARANQDRLPTGFSFRSEARRIELCRVWLALGRADLAAGLLAELAGAAAERAGSRLAILALLAAAREDADALEAALRLGEPEGPLRVFVEAGDPLRGLLERWLKSPRAAAEPRLSAYARRILAVFGAPSGPALAAVLPEPLSPREREVLALAARGLTNAQIAARLVLSVRTVKKHIENIHGKLGVENRTQAAARAGELNLLD